MNRGLFTQAENAANRWAEEQEKEQSEIDKAVVEIDNILVAGNGSNVQIDGKPLPQYIQEQVKEEVAKPKPYVAGYFNTINTGGGAGGPFAVDSNTLVGDSSLIQEGTKFTSTMDGLYTLTISGNWVGRFWREICGDYVW